MKKITIMLSALLTVALQSPAQQPAEPKAKASAAADDIITTLPATAKDSLFLQDTYIMSGSKLQHFTWSGHFYRIAIDGNGKDVYFKDLCSDYVFGTYVKGVIDGSTIKIPTGQHVFHEDPNQENGFENADLYLYSAKINADSTEVVLDKEAPYIELHIAQDGTITSDPERGAAYADPADSVVARNYTYKFAPFDSIAATTVVPQDAEVKKYSLEYMPEPGGSKVVKTAEVAFSGSDVYVKGLTQNVPGWVKGIADGDSVRFASRQYVGRYNNNENLLKDYAVFFNGAEATDETDVWGRVYATTDGIAFKYDKESGTLTAGNSVTETIGEQNPYSHMVAPKLTPAETGGSYAPAKPAAPEITAYKDFIFSFRMTVSLPTYDTEGKPLDTDSLYYRFYMDGEPFTFTKSKYNYIDEEMAEVPYAYLDYNGLGSDISKGASENERIIVLYDKYDEIGVECVYTVDGVTNVSDRYVYDVASKTGGVSGITANRTAKGIKSITYTDVNGTAVEHPHKGLYIKTVTYSDNTKVNSKVLK